MKKLILPLIACQLTYANFDIRSIEPSKSVEDSLNKMSLKKEMLLDKWSEIPLDKFPFYQSENKGLSSLSGAIARIVKKQDIESVNQYLLDERFQPGLNGTRIKILGGLCKRKGDYDFALQELIRVAYLGQDILSDDAYDRLLNDLLNQKGSDHYTHFSMGICGRKIEDTENHILMTETARYLTNQIMYDRTRKAEYDNQKNGFNEWMYEHLRYFFKHGFSEINSKPYAGYTISTLFNLYDFSEDKKVKHSAKILLDYLSMKYATESIGNRRYPTFRRQYRRYLDERMDEADALNAMMMYWVGNYEYLNSEELDLSQSILPYGDRFALNASISTYVPDKIVYENIYSKTPIFQLYDFDHGGKQVVYKTEDYLISGGGVHRRIFPPFSMLNDVLAAPTILIPKNKGRMLDDMLYYLGYNKEKKRSNLCVNKDFMCGFNIHIPESIKKCEVTATGKERSEWSFYNLKDPRCKDSAYAGLYIAIYNRTIKHRIHKKTKGKNFGLVEVKKSAQNFEEFKNSILKNNSKRLNRGQIKYTTSTGEELNVNLDPKKGQYNFEYNFNQFGRVRGTRHQMNDSIMRMFSPKGYFKEYVY